MKALFILFVVMPIVEMLVLIKVGGVIGALPTIGLVLLTAMLGVALLKQQGMSTIFNAQQKLDAGEIPVQEIADGIFLAVGGALLLTPGFITDAMGFCCLIPGLRHGIIRQLITMFKPNVVVVRSGESAMYSRSSGAQHHDVIDGEYKREEP